VAMFDSIRRQSQDTGGPHAVDTPMQVLTARLRTELDLVTDLTANGELVSVTCADRSLERNPGSRAAAEQRDFAADGVSFTLHARQNDIMLPVAEMVVNVEPQLAVTVRYTDGNLGTSAMPLFVARVAEIGGVDAATIPVTFPGITP